MRYVFHHIRNTKNIGDLACCPASYFPFEDAEVLGLHVPTPEADVVVYGGGHIYRSVQNKLSQSSARKVIWGIGLVAYRRWWLERWRLARAFELIGCRDYAVPGTEYVPCVSCMDDGFDAPVAPVHDVVLYWHKEKSRGLVRPEGIPSMHNAQGNLAESLSFIASGKTVVTNSYHGTYWALLMGRKVLSLPFNDKFAGFKYPPAFATATDWQEYLPYAVAAPPDYLEECRSINRAFFDKVQNL